MIGRGCRSESADARGLRRRFVRRSAQPSNPRRAAASGGRPSRPATVATFNSPWAMAFLPGSRPGARHRKAGPHLAGRRRRPARKQPVTGAPRGRAVDAGRTARRQVVARLRHRPASLSDLFGALGERRQRPRAGPRAAGPDADGARLDGLQRLWHDPAGGEGGQFGAIIAFAPDGKSLFLSSGERQRFTPAQDPSQPLGKILHLTLDGKPAPGNPMAGQTGAATVTITDPPADTEDAKTRRGPAVHLAGTEPHSVRDMEPRPSQSLRPRVRRPTGGCGKPRWARAAATSST